MARSGQKGVRVRFQYAEKVTPTPFLPVIVKTDIAKWTNPQSAFIKVLFGDEAGSASCIPGMPRRG